jgi:biotin carboxyl carrier protein
MNTEQHTRPRFRTDLVAQPIDEAGQRFVDVTDPDSGNTFRFYEVEYSIACAMDGQRDLDGLVQWAQVELGLEPSHEELETVISTLGDLGYLDANGAGAPGEVDVELGAPGISGASSRSVVPGGAALGDPGAPGEIDVELGAPGKSPIGRNRPTPPPAGDIELGSPGSGARDSAVPATTSGAQAEASFADVLSDEPAAGKPSEAVGGNAGLVMEFEAPTPPPAEVPIPEATLRPTTKADADEDGPTQLPKPLPHDFDDDEVSVDLSDHLSIGADDVKEAVRQSKVMQAVAVPQELLDELESPGKGDEKGSPASPAPTAAEVSARAKEAVPPPRTPAKDAQPGAAPVALPEKRAKAKPMPPVEPPPTQPEPAKSSSLTILLLLLAIVAVGAAAAWYYMTQVKGDAPPAKRGGAAAPAGAAGPQSPTARPAPPAPAATLEQGTPEPAVLTAAADAKIGWVVEAGSEADDTTVVVKLSGFERHEKKAEAHDIRAGQYQALLDRATEAGNQDKIEQYTAKVQEKQAWAAEERAKAEELFLKAPAAGTVEPMVGAGSWVKAGDELVRITPAPALVATFSGMQGQFAVGEPVQAETNDGAVMLDCTVTSFETGSLTVSCPAADGAPAGAPVVLAD